MQGQIEQSLNKMFKQKSVIIVIINIRTPYLLTYSIQQSPSEANRFSASQQIPHI
jgi:hypothetical protein